MWPCWSYRYISKLIILNLSVTFGNKPDENLGTVLVTIADTVGSSKRRLNRLFGLAPQIAFSEKATSQIINPNPQGITRLGRMRSLSGWTLWFRQRTFKELRNTNPSVGKNAIIAGLKIHQTRMKCLKKENATHRILSWWDLGARVTPQRSVSPTPEHLFRK